MFQLFSIQFIPNSLLPGKIPSLDIAPHLHMHIPRCCVFDNQKRKLIIIAALSCGKNDILIIENPEIHLHPSGQCELMEFLVFLAEKGLQVVMETHSDHVFNGLRRCVSSDRISSDKVRIYFFRQNEEKISMPVEIFLDEDGRVKNQQDGLFDQIEKDLDVILGW